MKDVYQNLARHLDNLPAGFPATKSGVEIRILKRLFTPERSGDCRESQYDAGVSCGHRRAFENG